ncbi:MAG: hypothetical protein KBA66_12115 [Leptospiraceae bacterium]|nr:hypothetical protein [Leptospiraceae bacterium]
MSVVEPLYLVAGKILLLMILLNCSKNPLQNGKDASDLKLTFFNLQSVGTTASTINWGCSFASQGMFSYGELGMEKFEFLPLTSTLHQINLQNLTPNTNYKYIAYCKNNRIVTSYIQSFQTLSAYPPTISAERGIWIVGGIGNDGLPVAQIDLYDPVIDTWFPNVTTIPTPRSFAGIAQVNGKIYVIGGINANSAMTNIVEEFNPTTLTWRSSTTGAIASLPTILQGALASNVGDSIYLLGGSTDIFTASAINAVYRFTPELGQTGTWSGVLFTIPFRVDYTGCQIDGTIYYNNGRDASGVQQTAADAFIPSGNTITSLSEASSTQGRFGIASVCYKPRTSDSYPADTPSIFTIGGSRTPVSNTSQPPTVISATNRFDYYIPSTNTIQSGNLPVNLYAPASEVSYETRKLYVFGGATTINIPLNTMYSIDVSNPTLSSWTASSVPSNVVARFGHKALLLNREK